MKKTVVSLVGAAAIAASAVALAGGPDAVAPAAHTSGFYMGGGLGYAYSSTVALSATDKAALKAVDMDTKEDKGFAFGAHLGYQFNQYVALEGGYMRLPRVGYSGDDDFVGLDDNNVFYGAVKGMYPLMNNKLNVFVKAGYAVIDSDVDLENTKRSIKIDTISETNYAPLVGAGVEYKVTPHLGVNAQYNVLIKTGSDKDTNDSRNFPTTHIGLVGLNYYF